MARMVRRAGEKDVLELLMAKKAEAESKTGVPPATVTMADEREGEANRIAAFQKREATRRTQYANLFEHATQAAKTVEAGDTELLGVRGAKLLVAKLEDLIGRGGIAVEMEEVHVEKAHRAAKTDQYAVTDEAKIAYRADILLPSGGTKTARCVVCFDGSPEKKQNEQFTVAPVFYDSLDQERPLTEAGLKAFMAGEPLTKAEPSKTAALEDERPVVFFNSDDRVLGFEPLDIPKHIVPTAIQAIRKAGFEVSAEYLDKTTGWGRIAHVVVAAPERHDELRTMVAQLVKKWDDKSWFERGLDDDKKYGIVNAAPGDKWFERSLEKGEKPKNPHEWPERSLEKPEQEGVASQAYAGTKMLRMERKKAAQAKTPAATHEAEKNVRQAKLTADAQAKSQEKIGDAAQRLAKLAEKNRPF